MTNPADDVRAVAREAEETADVPMPASARPIRPNKSVPVAVRLSPEDVAAIDQLAAAMGVLVSTLIRGWITDGLAARSTNTVQSALDQISTDVQRLREILA